MAAYVPVVLVQIVRAFIDPRGYISGRSAVYERGVVSRLRTSIRLLALYVIGLVSYALPLTYAGTGMIEETSDPPTQVAAVATVVGWNAADLWVFLRAFAEITAFLVTGSAAILCVLHLGVVLLRTSRGLLQSVHTIVYASGMYLAAIYSFAWALSISNSVVVADRLVLAIQLAFVDTVIDLSRVNVALSSSGATFPDTAEMTTTGFVLLVGLALSIIYLLFSLYAGVRANHGGSRLQAVGAVLFVLSVPPLYVLGSIAVSVLYT